MEKEKKGGATAPPHSIRERDPMHSRKPPEMNSQKINAYRDLGSDRAAGQSEACLDGPECRIKLILCSKAGGMNRGKEQTAEPASSPFRGTAFWTPRASDCSLGSEGMGIRFLDVSRCFSLTARPGEVQRQIGFWLR